MGYLDQPRDHRILLGDDLLERIDVVLELSDVALDRADLGCGVVELLRDGGLRARIRATRRDDQERQADETDATDDEETGGRRPGMSWARTHGSTGGVKE